MVNGPHESIAEIFCRSVRCAGLLRRGRSHARYRVVQERSLSEANLADKPLRLTRTSRHATIDLRHICAEEKRPPETLDQWLRPKTPPSALPVMPLPMAPGETPPVPPPTPRPSTPAPPPVGMTFVGAERAELRPCMPTPQPPIAPPWPAEIAPRSTFPAPTVPVEVRLGMLTMEPAHGPCCCWACWLYIDCEKKAESGSAWAAGREPSAPPMHPPTQAARIARRHTMNGMPSRPPTAGNRAGVLLESEDAR